MSSPSFTLEHHPLSWFKPYEKNPRKNDKVVHLMVASLREYGWPVPALARSTGEVCDGHLRLKAAANLDKWPGGGPDRIPVIICDGWTDAQLKAFRLAVNRSATWAEFDLELLAQEFGELKAVNFDLRSTGFEPTQVDACFRGANFSPATEAEQGKLDQKKPITCPECKHVFTP